MRRFNIDFFKRDFTFVHNTSLEISSLDDDYISGNVNTIEILPTLLVETGQLLRLSSIDYSFFGIVTSVSPGEYSTKVSFKTFLNIFAENVLFDTSWQGTGGTRPTLETVIASLITGTYISTSDVYQKLPISVTIDSSISQTTDWNLGIISDYENTHYSIINLYSDLIVNALKMYDIVIDVLPDFSDRIINLTITKRRNIFKISADLDNIEVKTLKYSSANIGINKLEVINTDNYTQMITFYVHPDGSWDTDNTDRITPVVRDVRTAIPSSDVEDQDEAFVNSAIDVAYGVLSGSSWDNLIELIAYAGDKNINPLNLPIGQVTTIWYKRATYTSILTGRIVNNDQVTLLFGSQRIEYSKRFKLNGGK